MADSTLPLNLGSGGKALDTESLTGAGAVTVERQRIEVVGAALAEIARVMNSAPAGSEYALVTRPIMPSSTVVSQGTAANLACTATLAAQAAASNSPTGVVSIGNSLGKTNVLKTGTLTSTAVTADQVVLTYTVTAAKTFYLQYLKWQARLTTYATTATNFGAISLETPSGTKVLTEEIFHAGIDGCYTLQFPEPIPVAAGVVIRVVCTPSAVTSFKWAASFGGYEK